MIVNVLWLGMLLSGSFFTCAKYNRKFEEIFSISCMITILALFLCGILGILKYSTMVFIGVSVLLYGYIIILFLLKKVSISSFINNFFTPAFFLLCVYFLLLNILDFNLLATRSDEFSHWMDSIQVMTHLDDFITNPASNSLYKSYPPAMTLFQYLLQKIYLLFNPDKPFCEWRMYLAFQIFSLSILFPFLKNFSFKNLVSFCCIGIILFIFPLPFFSDFLSCVYIDPVVAILAGCGFAMPIFFEKKDFLYTLHISLICAILVLTKDVGLYFACFIVLLNIIVTIINNHPLRSQNKQEQCAQMLTIILPILLLFLCKCGWNNMIQVNNAEVSFGNKIDLLYYTRMFFLNNDGTSMQTIVSTFKDALYSKPFYIGSTNITIKYFDLFWISFFVFYYLCRRYISAKTDCKVTVIALGAVIFAQLVMYIYCLGATYVYSFEEHEALRMASYARYNNIAYLAVWTVILVMTLFYIQDHTLAENRNVAIIGVTICLFLLSPMKNVSDFLNRDLVRDSFYYRSEFTNMKEEIKLFCEESDRIYFISQKSEGTDFRAVKFAVYPNHITNTEAWSLGEPYSDKDMWTKNLTADQWLEVLQNDYDYVALFQVDDLFINNYGILFADPNSISSESVYYINTHNGKLEKCE